MSDPKPIALGAKEVRKSFGGVDVLHGVDLHAEAGSVVALLGENGAGKSTLVKILSGVNVPDSGTIVIGSEAFDQLNPRLARELGISIVHVVGKSPVAARLAGIPTRRVIFIAFMLSAVFTGLAGLIRLSQLGAASVNARVGFVISALTAVILGGASLSGGRGSIQGTVLAVLVVGVLANGLIQLRVPSFWIELAQGALLLGAVTFEKIRIRISGEETAT